MRLGGYILVEATLGAALLTGAAFVGGAGVTRVRQAWRHGGEAAAALAAEPPGALRSRGELSSLPDLRVALESAGTFLGMSDELLLERVRTQPIVRFKLNHGGSSLSFRVDFADGSRAAWKPIQTNLQTVPRKEVAAYRLNRLLGLNAVPPAAPRAVTRDDLFEHLHPDSEASAPRIRAEAVFDDQGRTVGAASYWIPVIRESGFDVAPGRQDAEAWLTQGETIPMEQREMAAQISDLTVFDFLTANPDRYSGGNMKMSGGGEQLFFMDNTMSFFLELEGKDRNRLELYRTQRFSRSLYEALDRLDLPTLERLMGGGRSGTVKDRDGEEILTEAEIRAVVARREIVRRYIAEMIDQFGAKNVLIFP